MNEYEYLYVYLSPSTYVCVLDKTYIFIVPQQTILGQLPVYASIEHLCTEQSTVADQFYKSIDNCFCLFTLENDTIAVFPMNIVVDRNN